MELAQHCTCFVMSVLFDKPTRTFLEEPNATGNDETRNDLEREGEAPCDSRLACVSDSSFACYSHWKSLFTLKQP